MNTQQLALAETIPVEAGDAETRLESAIYAALGRDRRRSDGLALYAALMADMPKAPSIPVAVHATFPKTCACGLVHTAEGWARLAFAYRWDDIDGGRYESRHCICESTISAELQP